MRVLTPRAVANGGELAGFLADSAAHLEAGLRPLQRALAAGEVTVDLACADSRGRLVIVVTEVVAGSDAVLRAVEAAAWWGEQVALLPRLFPDAALDPQGAPRAMVAAWRFTDRALRLLRAMGPAAPEAVECRLFQDADGPVVGLERLDLARSAGLAEQAGATAVGAAPAADAKRAAALVERLERLRFSEGIR